MDPIIADFLSYIEHERGLARHTISAYKRDIEQLYLFLHPENESQRTFAWPPTGKEIEAYARFVHDSKLQLSSQVRRLVAMKAFLKFLYREEYIPTNLASMIETPHQWQKIPQILDYSEMEALLKAPNMRTKSGVRDRAIMELLYGTGVRVSELCQLSLYDVTDEHIRVHGKGGKERIIPIGAQALEAVDRYIHNVRSLFDSDTNEALFVTGKGIRVTREFVWGRIRFYAKALGITKQVSPHVFRHTYASHLLEGGADVRVIQELLGHAHISSTDRYTHVSTAQLQELFYNFHPRWD